MTRRSILAALARLALPCLVGAQGQAAAPPISLPPGMAALPLGGVRVAFDANGAALPEGAAPALAELGRALSATPAGTGRITVEGQASGPADDPSAARRLSLARAIEVRRALVAGGLAETRVDVRPLGRTAAGLDAADVLPPAARAKAAEQRRQGQGR
jgi:outer membrane protein OmpA-like peptidoglycan-associated protein